MPITKEVIAELVKRTGVRLDEDDPAIVMVELNRIMLEHFASEATRSIDQVAKRFTETATTQADDFVAVANEALSKFTKKTNDIKAALDALPSPSSPPSRDVPVAEVSPPPPAAVSSKHHPAWFGVAFLGGLVVGVGMSFAF